MALSRRTGRSRLTIALLVVTSITVLTLDFRDSAVVSGAQEVAATIFSPLRGVAETVTDPFANAWNGVTGYDDLEQENEELRAMIDEMRGERVRDEDAAEQPDKPKRQRKADKAAPEAPRTEAPKTETKEPARPAESGGVQDDIFGAAG